jgi:hypothetical protein
MKKRHKWGEPNKHGDQECLNGCGTLRAMLIGGSMRGRVPTPHYQAPGSKRWGSIAPPCRQSEPLNGADSGLPA